MSEGATVLQQSEKRGANERLAFSRRVKEPQGVYANSSPKTRRAVARFALQNGGASRTRGVKMSEGATVLRQSEKRGANERLAFSRRVKEPQGVYANSSPKTRRAVAKSALRRRWCGHRDLNSDGVIHTPLKRTRLPVPPWPHSENSILLPRVFVNGFGGEISRKLRREYDVV